MSPTPRPGFVFELPWIFDPDAEAVGLHVDSFLGELDVSEDDHPQSPTPTGSLITLSSTVGRFVRSDADVVMCYGARGEGKSVGGVARILRIAHALGVQLRVAVVRDTWVNIERTVFETLRQGHLAGWWDVVFANQSREALLDGGVAKLYFFGMDRPADANKFQGFEAGLLWLEEPAPAADISSGIPAEVFAMGVSSLRQPGVPRPTVQITMNPPDRSHWTLELQELLDDAGHPDMRCEVFRIPTGENVHLPAGYRERMRLGLEAAQRPDLIRRLSEGNIGTVIVGVPVTPEFSDMHVAKEPIEIRLGWPTYRAFDAGLNPTCLHAQTTPMGHLNIIGCVVGMNMGMEELLEVHVIPWEAKMNLRVIRPGPRPPRDQYGHLKAWSTARPMVRFRDIGDPACVQREQTHSERSVARVIENLLGATFEKGRVEWAARLNSLRAVLTRNIGGRPMLQIDPECVPLIEALEGRWRYARFPSGKVSALPIKDLCVDDETEILTQDGFRGYTELRVGTPVYGFDLATRRLIPDEITAVHETSGYHELRTWDNASLSVAVTPNHQMIVAHGAFGHWGPVRWKPVGLKRADEVNTAYGIPGIQGITGHGRRTLSDDFVRLCAWVMTEGTYRRREPEIWIVQSSVHQTYVDQLGKLTGLWPSTFVRRWDGSRWVFIVKHELAAMVKMLMPDKHPSAPLIHQLLRSQMLLFLFEALKGDGSHHAGNLALLDSSPTRRDFWRPFRQGGKGVTPVLCCATPGEADAVQHIATLVGLRSQRRLNDRSHSDHRVSLKRYHKYGGLLSGAQGRHIVAHVWCPQTRSGTWIARRRGSIWPTGNSSHPGDALSYLTSVLYPSDELTRRALAPPGPRVRSPASWAGR